MSEATEWERGGSYRGSGAAQGYSFDIPDYTEEIVALKKGEDLRKVILKTD